VSSARVFEHCWPVIAALKGGLGHWPPTKALALRFHKRAVSRGKRQDSKVLATIFGKKVFWQKNGGGGSISAFGLPAGEFLRAKRSGL